MALVGAGTEDLDNTSATALPSVAVTHRGEQRADAGYASSPTFAFMGHTYSTQV